MCGAWYPLSSSFPGKLDFSHFLMILFYIILESKVSGFSLFLYFFVCSPLSKSCHVFQKLLCISSILIIKDLLNVHDVVTQIRMFCIVLRMAFWVGNLNNCHLYFNIKGLLIGVSQGFVWNVTMHVSITIHQCNQKGE